VRIPTNRQDPKYDFFNTPDNEGLTQYQRKMVKMMKDCHNGKVIVKL
jgi:hypothetical protein